ncbi:MAG: porin [Bacteriovorax sp.]|nr:porin [Rhizobacter sp.]
MKLIRSASESTPARTPLALACAIAFAAVSGVAHADQAADMQAKLDALQKQVAELQTQMSAMVAKAPRLEEKAAASSGVRLKPGDALTFQVGEGNEVTLYGHVDVSADYQTTGLKNAVGATGNNGWIGDVSSNLSFFGVRGSRQLNDDLKAVFQFETEVMYSATTGTSDQAPDGTAQKSGLGSRNSYVGLQSASLGAIKLGKTDTPYKSSTGRLDPFANSVADYNSIMGNTGGDARAEFDLRLPHSIWYESPRLSGWSFSGLVSPGQNRSTDGLQYALGEPDCTGGNTVGPQNPASGCNDGSFGTAYSASVAYEMGPLFATAAYEMHKRVNRGGDDLAPGSVGIANETAFKVGAQYTFAEATTLSLIWEKLKRNAITPALDERSRNGTWVALTQKLTANDDLNLGWAHAGKTPGNPNGAPLNMSGVDGSGKSVNNAANQYSLGLKHRFPDKKVTVYAVYTDLRNSDYAHYALGVSGHGIVTRNKDGDGNVFSGYDAKAISFGLTYDF